MIRINFREYFYLYESIDQNFDQWLIDLKTYARPDESKIKTFNIPDNKKQFIINTLKSKNIENKQYMKYLIGFATTPQSSHIEDYDRAVDTLKWFIQTNRLTKAQVEADGWFNTGKRATELTREKDQILNPYSKTKEKKEKKLGIAEDILPLFQSGNIKIYFSPKVTNEKSKEEDVAKDAEKPEIKARHKILCKYGKGTDWCTASATGTYHAQYSDRNIYIVHIDDKPAYQFMDCTAEDTDERCQFHDAKNEEVEEIPLKLAELIMEKLPKIASFYECVKNTFNKAIYNAIKTNNLDIAEYLMKKYVEIVGGAVYHAASKGNLPIVKYLVEKGAKIGDEAVRNAAESGNLDLVKYLVDEKGAKICRYALPIAVGKGSLDVVKYLIEKGAKTNYWIVYQAAESGNLDLVKYLVEKGEEIGDQAVGNAANKGNLPIVKYLVEKGAKIGDNAVRNAGKSNNLDLVKYLVEKGAKICRYAVSNAALFKNLDIVKYLVEKGATIGDSVASAAQVNNLDIVKYLVEKGGKIRDDTIEMITRFGYKDIADYLNSAKNINV